MTPQAYDGPIFFVGGAPRSGTTVSHALICTSARMNAYHPEISYVTPMIRSYTIGQNNWDGHTRAFFAERDHFRLHMRGLLNQTFSHIHRALRSPDLLCVKDPLLTPYFPRVLELFKDRARFVTVIRNPYDVVRSRQEVARKAGTDFNERTVSDVARQFVQSYNHIDNPALADQMIFFRYEDLLSEEVQSKIKAFTGCDDIDTENVWGERKTREPEKSESSSKDPWYSPKYHGSIDLSNRLSPLEERFQVVTRNICGALMERFGY